MSYPTATYIRLGHSPRSGAPTPTYAMPAGIAYRAATDTPEDTFVAFKLAWQQGADGIAEGFCLTRDGKNIWLKRGHCSETGASGQSNPDPLASNRPPVGSR